MTGGPTRVRTGSRLHIGFRNLCPDRPRVFGGIGFAIERPGVVLTARPANGIQCDHQRVATIAERVVELLSVSGASIRVESDIPPHHGYGSGTQLTLATYLAIAHAFGHEPAIREHAARLDRGGRSGVGVACFEHGGFVVDEGQETESARRNGWRGERVPSVAHREPVPESWRVLLVRPVCDPGRSGVREAASIERTIERADDAGAERIERLLQNRVLPGLGGDDIERFGRGITEIDSITGEWFRSEQSSRYRPPGDRIIRQLAEAEEIVGWGQSSWGPIVYGFTTTGQSAAAAAAGRDALAAAGLDGSVAVVAPRNRGAAVTQTGDFEQSAGTPATDKLWQVS